MQLKDAGREKSDVNSKGAEKMTQNGGGTSRSSIIAHVMADQGWQY